MTLDPIRWIDTPKESDKTKDSLLLLTELVTDFESVVEGEFHTISIARYDAEKWQINYSYYPAHPNAERVTRALYAKDLSDWAVKNKHLELMKRFIKEA